MSAKGEALRAEIKTMVSGEVLVQVTNDDKDATTVNDTRLLAACERALGAFRYRSGHEPMPETPNYTHIEILELGVMYLLHQSKNFSSSVATDYKKEFVLACGKFRELSIIDADTSSKTVRTAEKSGSKPDMDLGKAVLSGRRNSFRANEINEN